MSRNTYGNLDTIEYIGARPQKPKKNFFGGWVIVVIAIGMAVFFGRPLIASLRNEQVSGNAASASAVVQELKLSKDAGAHLAAAALEVATGEENSLSSSELLIACYRNAQGLDLRQALHADMDSAFEQYPQLWNEVGVNRDVDHTRLPNILRFFHRSGDDVQSDTLKVGDVIFWSLVGGSQADAGSHCAIVVPGPGQHRNEMWIVHSTIDGVKWENKINEFSPVRGRYRFGQ